MILDRQYLEDCARRALSEDLGETGDLTVRLSLPEDRRCVAQITTRQEGVLAGVEIARACFSQLDQSVEFGPEDLRDGAALRAGEVVATVEGGAAALLAAERTALNFLQRLSGIASLTRKYVAAVADLGTTILDTRKTTPGLRLLEKHAVSVAGGINHRVGLFDGVLLKENHFLLSGQDYEAVVRQVCHAVDSPVVVEARTEDEALAAVAGGSAVVLLDNFEPGPELARIVSVIRDRADRLGRALEIECSGGVTLSTVRYFAECGIDRISVGALTHSAEAVDMSMLTNRLQ